MADHDPPNSVPRSAGAQPAGELPGRGLLGWLGRQVGYVARAVKNPPTAPTDPSRTLYRQTNVTEKPHPLHPNVTLRRTVTDEAVEK